ncbi:hypothetical protein [Saccharothrix xinjiangensis]|uniref:ANTAR domain-containing protein n=1 Tax=Saccharothrix xinjiangensis TaxID=204798 RepID=A0ABV9XU18_9PSEU
MSLPPYDPARDPDPEPPWTAADSLSKGEALLQVAQDLEPRMPESAQLNALLGVGWLLSAVARRHDEACREVADVLGTARPGADS